MFEWHEPIKVPRHDEPDALRRLESILAQLFDSLGCLSHPDFNCPLVTIWSHDGLTGRCLRVGLFLKGAVRHRYRQYCISFSPDGSVEIVTEHDDKNDVSSAGRKQNQKVQGWPQGVRHMLQYMAQVLRASASWEISLAENLEVLAPRQ